MLKFMEQHLYKDWINKKNNLMLKSKSKLKI